MTSYLDTSLSSCLVVMSVARSSRRRWVPGRSNSCHSSVRPCSLVAILRAELDVVLGLVAVEFAVLEEPGGVCRCLVLRTPTVTCQVVSGRGNAL